MIVLVYTTEKYWKNTSHALLFYTGNEGPIDQFWNNTGFIFEAAEQLDALVIFGEHVSNCLYSIRCHYVTETIIIFLVILSLDLLYVDTVLFLVVLCKKL